MNQFKKSRLIITSSVVIFLSFSFLYFTVVQGFSIPVVSDVVNSSLSTVNRVFSIPTAFFSEQKNVIQELMDTYSENRELKETIAKLEAETSENDSLEKENESLRASLELTEKYADKVTNTALVLDRSSLSWMNEITVDLGSDNGVTEGMLVLANGGLVGVVESAYSASSDVSLLTNSDESLKIPVKISTNTSTLYGILNGYDTETGSFIISQLNSTEGIESGNTVVTSDLGGNTPSNLLVGTVNLVETSSKDLSVQVFVTPAADFSNLYSVVIVENE